MRVISIRYYLLVILFMIDKSQLQQSDQVWIIENFIILLLFFNKSGMNRDQLKNISNSFESGKHSKQKQKAPIWNCEQVDKIREELAYSKYLAELRNNKTKVPFRTYCKLGVESVQNNTTIFPFEQTPLNTFYRTKQNTKRQHLKLSLEWNEDVVNENVLYISQQMDKHLENNLGIPSIVVPKNSKSCAQTQQSLLTSNINQEQNIKPFYSASNQDIDLSLLQQRIQQRIKKMAGDSLARTKEINFFKQSSVARILQGEVGFKIRKLQRGNRIFDKTQTLEAFPKFKRTNKENIQNKVPTKKTGEKFQQSRSLSKSESDLFEIINKYSERMRKYRVNDGHLMTKTREEGIFFNEYIKKARKSRYLEILQRTIGQKSKGEQQKQVKQEENEGQILRKLSNIELTKLCARKFQYLNQLKLQKL